MKVIVAVIVALASASAIRSGPYAPSGWRPQGPAFYLPSEVQKPAENPGQDITLIEPEASGSEGLREYGPPKVQESPKSVQTLPDVVTEQAFYVAEPYMVKVEENVVKVEENVENAAEYGENKEEQMQAEVNSEANAEIVETTEAVTEMKLAEELIDARTLNVDVERESTASVDEIAADTEDVQEVEATTSTATRALQNIVQEENVEEVTKAEEANNAVVLGNLAVEAKAEQVQQMVEEDRELKNQEGSASVQVPEGFLEYGPPGFREYGPPKADQLLRSSYENNEVRRRRFSPKFRSY